MTFKDFEERAADPALAKQRAEEDRIRRVEEQARLRRADELKEVAERRKRLRRSKGVMPWLEALWVALIVGACVGGLSGLYTSDDSWTVSDGLPVEVFGDVILIFIKAISVIAAPFVVIGVPWFLDHEYGDSDKPLFVGARKIAFYIFVYFSIAAFSYLAYSGIKYFEI